MSEVDYIAGDIEKYADQLAVVVSKHDEVVGAAKRLLAKAIYHPSGYAEARRNALADNAFLPRVRIVANDVLRQRPAPQSCSCELQDEAPLLLFPFESFLFHIDRCPESTFEAQEWLAKLDDRLSQIGDFLDRRCWADLCGTFVATYAYLFAGNFPERVEYSENDVIGVKQVLREFDERMGAEPTSEEDLKRRAVALTQNFRDDGRVIPDLIEAGAPLPQKREVRGGSRTPKWIWMRADLDDLWERGFPVLQNYLAHS